MKRSLTRALLRLVVIGAVILSFVFHSVPSVAATTQTAPGTAITNTASATYTDANNVSYTTNSNTVTTTVQNAPSLSISNTNTQTVSPGEEVTDTFTVTNTGNATGAITLTTPTQTGASATIPTNAYVLNSAATGTCSVATPCSIATLNAQPALATAATGTPIMVGVEYTVATTDAAGATITTALAGTIMQTAVGTTAPAEMSPTASASEIDTVAADARLDLYKTVVAPTSTTSDIAYTIVGNDGGGFGAHATYSAGAFLGLTGTAGVVAVIDKIPTLTGATTQTTLVQPGTGAVSGLPAGDTATIYYSESTATPLTWSTTYNAAATYIAVFVTTTAANGVVFASDPGSTAGTTQATSQFSFTFDITQPIGPGAANTNSLVNIANSIIGGNPGANGIPIIAPGVPVDSAYETGTTPVAVSTFNNTPGNATPSTGTTAPGGASNDADTQAFTSAGVVNGPFDSAAATGSYNGTVAVTNQDDFTAVGYSCGATTGSTANCAWPTGGIAIPMTLTNTGNASDNLKIYATAPAGYTVTLYSTNGCPTTLPTVLPIAPYQTTGTPCTENTVIGATSASGGSTTSGAIAVASGGTVNYIAVYTAATGTVTPPFTPVDFQTIVYGSTATVTGGVPTTGNDANETTDVIYPGGPLQVTKTQAIVSNCSTSSTGLPAAAVCPGGTITYSLAFKNNAPAGYGSSTAPSGTEPAFALNGAIAPTPTLVDDGTATGSWGATTYGIDAVVAPALAGGTATYTPAANALSTGSYAAGTKTAGPTKISVALPTVQPGASGTVSFQVTVK